MTTIQLSAHPTTRLCMTPRGRRAVALLAASPAIVALALAAVSGGAALATHEQGAPAGTFETVTVMAGDSLWSIAEDVAPDADPRDVIGAITRLNALDSSGVSAGQRLSIPLEYSTAD